MNRIFRHIFIVAGISALCTACDDFVFGNVHVDYSENPLAAKGIAHSGADRYVDSLMKIKVTQPINNPDPQGAFNN